MINNCSKLFLSFSILLLTGCSKVDLHFAEKAYQEAKSTQNSKATITALTTLAALSPEEYQGQLDSAKIAITQLQQAKLYLAESNYYLAYLNGHSSYRTFPTKESKAVLLEAGAKIRFVVDVQANIVKSFTHLPKSITKVLVKYQNQPVLEWDVIEINAVIGQLGKAASVINSSLAIIEREESKLEFPEIETWRTGINNQLIIINKIQMHLINIALCSSANMLEQLNVQLSEDSTNLLSLVREALAEEAMRPNFIKAKEEYEPYENLAINLSLASSLAQRNTHAKWYSHWKSIEVQVLEGSDSFSDYPALFSTRAKQLSAFKAEAKKSIPNVSQGFSSLDLFMSKYGTIYDLIDKLNRDRMILNYGSSSV